VKVALVHDYFTQLGGAERVVEAMYQMLPNPTVFATVSNPQQLPEGLRSADIRTSWMRRLPAMDRYYRHYFPLYPLGVAGLNLKGYDLVVSSSSGYAKGVKVDLNAMHVCYCHTPMRWVWRYSDYASRESFGIAQRVFLPLLISNLRRWDEHAARQPDQFVVNSTAVAERVWSAYKRRAIVIPPPIDVDRFKISPVQEDFYLVLSRLVSYKRIDLAVDACTRMKRRLVVIGDGPDRARLESMAGPTIKFLGRVSDTVVESYAGRCRALLFPGEEDFGMVPLEVNAAGRPVIAYKGGGALDTVIGGVSGILFDRSTSASLSEGIEACESRSWNTTEIRKHAEHFDSRSFRENFLALLRILRPKCFPSQSFRGNSAVA
jgi:glycosyltransferase involved in cell wall biosynthesis